LIRNMDFLRETQYPRARDLLKGQKECFEMEREHLVEIIKSVVRDPEAQETVIYAVGGSFRTVESKAETTTLAASGWAYTHPWEGEDLKKKLGEGGRGREKLGE
jgi:hypothetical protein